jgi:hypothetical protein
MVKLEDLLTESKLETDDLVISSRHVHSQDSIIVFATYPTSYPMASIFQNLCMPPLPYLVFFPFFHSFFESRLGLVTSASIL